eukprot:11769926-Prorocentrum_lima.AAC.1
MTSSLVGSEMCIRDRFKLPSPSSEATSRLTTSFDHIVHHDLFFVDSPVSYTHLTLPTICSV